SKPSAQWTQGPRDLGVLFGLLLRHPDLTVRQRTRDVVLDHLTQSGPFHSSDAIATLLNTTAGTLLDPFRLTDEERDAAVLFARIAFSEVHAQDAVRIVPSSTIGRA